MLRRAVGLCPDTPKPPTPTPANFKRMSKESFVAEGTARALPIPCTVLTQMDQKEDTKNLHELIELGSIHDRLEE